MMEAENEKPQLTHTLTLTHREKCDKLISDDNRLSDR